MIFEYPSETIIDVTPLQRRRFAMARIFVLCSSAALMLPGARSQSATVVELAHIPSGLAAWQDGSLGIYRVCAPLTKWLYEFPAFVAGERVIYSSELNDDTKERWEWEIGLQFQDKCALNYRYILFYTRMCSIAMTLFCGHLICNWSTRLFGFVSGLISLCAWCWMVPVLAHGSLVTSDIASAAMLLLAAKTFSEFTTRPRALNMMAAGIALGLAVSTKFTSLILYPSFIILLIFKIFYLNPRNERGRSAAIGQQCSDTKGPTASKYRLILHGVGLTFISFFTINCVYIFRGTCLPFTEFIRGDSSLAKFLLSLVSPQGATWVSFLLVPLPVELFRGIDSQLSDVSRNDRCYLLGCFRQGGWWYWYIAASAIKLPLPAIVLMCRGVFRSVAISKKDAITFWSTLSINIISLEIFLLVSTTTGTGTNAAFRYLLPSFALLCVSAGSAARKSVAYRKRWDALLCAWLFGYAISAAPDFLGWHNEFGWIYHYWTGKPPLIGDSLDWGQDLNRLREWGERHANEGSTCVAVYGLSNGEVFGLSDPVFRASFHEIAFLAVSENILWDYDKDNCVAIGGERIHFNKKQIKYLQTITNYERIGRTIRIYDARKIQGIRLMN